MTDSTLPDGSNPIPDEPEQADEPEPADEAKQAEDRSVDATTAGEDVPGSPTRAAPMTDSTDGGLDGGDPGVEE